LLWVCCIPTDAAEIALAESRYPAFPYDINKAIPEVVHRYFAATLGLIAILLTYISFKTKEDKKLRWWSLGLLVFICCQGLFGYLTVSLKTVANHCYWPSVWRLFYA
jgi:cytochrome c oxidase assembly protein subunit 15